MSRKLLCSLLGAAMVLAVSGSAFADEVDMNEDGTVNNPEAVEVAEGDLSFWSLLQLPRGTVRIPAYPMYQSSMSWRRPASWSR